MIQQQSRTGLLKIVLPLMAALFLCPAMDARAQNISLPPPDSAASKSTEAAAKVPEFEVASVKENKSGTNNSRWMNTPDGIGMTNISLKSMVADAYGIKQDLVSGGPAWVESSGYDVEAKVAGEDVPTLKKLTGKQRNVMLQALLADRFHLNVHIEKKTLPIYDLQVAKGGSKLMESPVLAEVTDADKKKMKGMWTVGPGYFTANGINIESLAQNLGYVVHRTVVDNTGLTGKYDFKLKYAPEEEHAGPKADNGADPGPSIFTALEEQLGLKLQPTKGPVDTLVIDHVEKPSDN